MQTVALINESSKVSGADLLAAKAALQIQLNRDFSPKWGLGANLVQRTAPVHGEPRLYLIDSATVAGALGYHDLAADAPEGFVFVQTSQDAGIPWQSVLSHELLELLADPWIDSVADTVYQGAETLVYQEICDPVESDSYLINGIPVSNFVLPVWFLPQQIAGTPHTDFLRKLSQPLTMTSGGYFSYAQQIGNWQQVFGDKSKASPHDKDYGPFSRNARRVGKKK